jgi:hypothetical protein
MAEWIRGVPIIRRQEDETGFHCGVAAAQSVLIQSGRIPNRPPRESILMRGGDNGAHLDTAPKRSAAVLGCEFLGRPRPVDWGLAAGRSQNPQAETPATRGQCQDAPETMRMLDFDSGGQSFLKRVAFLSRPYQRLSPES